MAVKCHPPGTNRVSADISQPDRTWGTSFAGLFGRPAKHLKTMGSRLARSLADPLTRTLRSLDLRPREALQLRRRSKCWWRRSALFWTRPCTRGWSRALRWHSAPSAVSDNGDPRKADSDSLRKPWTSREKKRDGESTRLSVITFLSFRAVYSRYVT